MIKVALFGAGGKMGLRAVDRLIGSKDYDVKYIEIGKKGIEELEKRGISITSAQEAVQDADILVAAVPDILIGKVLCENVPKLKAGALVMTLDPAAARAGMFPQRTDIAYFVTHPCHPSIFNKESDLEARLDYFGAVKAKQSIVNALVQGTEEDYKKGEAFSKVLYSPLDDSYRMTVEQMTLLEPALTETLAATCAVVIKEGLDYVIELGVPAKAAHDFLMGHLNTAFAISFKELDTAFSDGCMQAINRAKKHIIREDWKTIFKDENVMKEVSFIAKGDAK